MKHPFRAAGVGALLGLALGGFATPRLSEHDARAVLALAAALGAAIALLRPHADALARPGLAALGAACGLLMARVPEPTFFLLAPLVASAAAWPFGPPSREERAPPRWVLPLIFASATVVFFFQSAHRHFSFASGSRDLGLFYQTHWLIAQGLPPMNTVIGMHALADHLAFVYYAVAPLLRLHDGAETLLLVQAVAVASAVFPLHALGQRLLGRPVAGLTLAGVFLLTPDLHMGLMYDYNPTLIGAAALLWTAWALVCRGLTASLVMMAFTCLCKENFCLYVATLALVLAMRVAPWRRCVAIGGLALAFFAIEMTLIYPRFRAEGFLHWEYEDLGDTPIETAAAAVTRPDRALSLLVDHPQKRRSLLQPLAATGFLGLADPVSLLLQAPNWAERFLSTRRTRWWGYHYGVPAAATAVIGLLLGWKRIREAGRPSDRLPTYVLLCALIVGALPPYLTPEGNRGSDLYHWRPPAALPIEDIRSQRAAVEFVGRDPYLKVAAQHHLLPHLAGRRVILMLPRAAEADVIALQLNGGTWPEGRPTWRRRVQAIWRTGAFHVAFCERSSVVLRRGPAEGSVSCPAWEAFVARP